MYDSTNTNGLTERSLGRTPTNFAIRSILGNLTRSGLSRPLAKCMAPLMSVTRRLLISRHFFIFILFFLSVFPLSSPCWVSDDSIVGDRAFLLYCAS